ncbi:hypothetical protein HDU81_005516 [Chytriomyces hyalinus]|nr:hypothetical protein HDU81_005516 [Chytriomyces hyalinus]
MSGNNIEPQRTRSQTRQPRQPTQTAQRQHQHYEQQQQQQQYGLATSAYSEKSDQNSQTSHYQYQPQPSQPQAPQPGYTYGAYNQQYQQHQPQQQQQYYGQPHQQQQAQYGGYDSNYNNYVAGPLPSQTNYANDNSTHYPATFHTNNGSQDYEMSRLPTVKPIAATDKPWLKEEQEPQWKQHMERFLCCCCPKNKKHRMICGGFVAGVLISLGVIMYLYIPRYPQIKVYSINFANIIGSSSAYSFTYKDPNVKDLNTLQYRMNLSMELGTYNPNSYDMSVESIDLLARLTVNTSYVGVPLKTTPLTSFGALVAMVGKAPTPPAGYTGDFNAVIGTSKYGAIVFPAKATINYTMVFLLDFTPDPKLGLLADPTINEIASACGITDRKNGTRPLAIHYDATSVIPALKPFGFAPTLSNDLHINCPFSKSQIDAVIDRVQNKGEPIMQALQAVFSDAPPPPPPTIVDNTPPLPDNPPPPAAAVTSAQPNVQPAATTGNGRTVATGAGVETGVDTVSPVVAPTNVGTETSAPVPTDAPTASAVQTESPTLDRPNPTGPAPTSAAAPTSAEPIPIITLPVVIGSRMQE